MPRERCAGGAASDAGGRGAIGAGEGDGQFVREVADRWSVLVGDLFAHGAQVGEDVAKTPGPNTTMERAAQFGVGCGATTSGGAQMNGVHSCQSALTVTRSATLSCHDLCMLRKPLSITYSRGYSQPSGFR